MANSDLKNQPNQSPKIPSAEYGDEDITLGKNKYNVYQYPENVGSKRYPHYIIFYINVNTKSSIAKKPGVTLYDKDMTKTAGMAVGVTSTAGNRDNNLTAPLKSMGGFVESTLGKYGKQIAEDMTNFVTSYKRLNQAIILYTPGSVKADYSADYELAASGGIAGTLLNELAQGANFGEASSRATGNLMSTVGRKVALGAGLAAGSMTAAALGGAVGAVGGALTLDNKAKGLITGGLAGGGAGVVMATSGIDNMQGLMNKATGKIVNPREEQVFRRIDFRTFQFSYLFTPKNPNEAQQIFNIIKQFKVHMHPEVLLDSDTGKAGMYLVMPSEFDIEFHSHGSENEYINKIATCALTNVAVDYSPNQNWVTFDGEDNPPVITMALTFRELEPLTRQMTEKGF